MAGFIEFPITGVAARLGIQIRPHTLGRTEVQAHCPFCEDSKAHLSLNTQKNLFYCHRCKENGNSVTLYAKLMGVDNKTAYHELADGKVYALQPPPTKTNDEQQPKPLHTRHDVYYDFLQMLDLSEPHRKKLLERGLSPERIERNLYRSVPMGNNEAILKELSQSYDLAGIPGFFTKNGAWDMYRRHGFFIPVCTVEGYIQGLQIRLDGEAHRKYRWFSSRYEENGTPAFPWVHVTGNTDSHTACVTEGALKADAASSLSKDALFVSVPGVNCLRGLPDVLKTLNITKVIETFDMDKRQNPHVAQAVSELAAIVHKLGLKFQSCRWDSQFKGIDEYLLSRIAG